MASKEKKREVPKMTGTPKNIVCYGCSLLCDDIFVELDANGKLIRTVNACFRGNDFLKNFSNERRFLSPFQKEMGLTMNLSMDETLQILTKEIKNANSISFYGLGAISYNQQIEVIKTIQKLKQQNKKIHIDNCSNIIHLSVKYGLNLASIGQAINNGDIFIFYNTDPTHSHPKLAGKLLFSRGLFRSTGKEVKKCILFDTDKSNLIQVKDIFIDSNKINTDNLLLQLNRLLNEENVNNIQITNLNENELSDLKKYLKAAEYGIIVTTIPLDRIKSEQWIQQVQELSLILNKAAKGRFSIIPLTLTSNELGLAHAVLSSFSKEDLKKIIEPSVEPSDLAIIFGGEYLQDVYKNQEFQYPEKKKILFDNFPSDVSKIAKINIPFKIPGIELEDISIRLDGINVNLKKWADSPQNILSISDIFKKIEII